jgi:hypothetical protein
MTKGIGAEKKRQPLSYMHTHFPGGGGWWGEFSSLGHMAPARKTSAARYVVDDEKYSIEAERIVSVRGRVMVVCRFYWSAARSYRRTPERGG